MDEGDRILQEMELAGSGSNATERILDGTQRLIVLANADLRKIEADLAKEGVKPEPYLYNEEPMYSISAEHQWQARQLYTQAMQTFESAWGQHYVGNYNNAWVLYEQASSLFQSCIQILGSYTADHVFYNLARCRVNLSWLAWATGNPVWYQFLEQALSHLQQAAQRNPSNPTYQQAIFQVMVSLGYCEPPYPRAPVANDANGYSQQVEAQIRELRETQEQLRQTRNELWRDENRRKAEECAEKAHNTYVEFQRESGKRWANSFHNPYTCNNICCKICGGW